MHMKEVGVLDIRDDSKLKCYFTLYYSCGILYIILHFPIELVSSGSGHENVGDGQVVVDGDDHERVPSPKNASREDGDLLVGRDFVGRFIQISNV